MFKMNDHVTIKVGHPDRDMRYKFKVKTQKDLDDLDTLMEQIHDSDLDYVLHINGHHQTHD